MSLLTFLYQQCEYYASTIKLVTDNDHSNLPRMKSYLLPKCKSRVVTVTLVSHESQIIIYQEHQSLPILGYHTTMAFKTYDK